MPNFDPNDAARGFRSLIGKETDADKEFNRREREYNTPRQGEQRAVVGGVIKGMIEGAAESGGNPFWSAGKGLQRGAQAGEAYQKNKKS